MQSLKNVSLAVLFLGFILVMPTVIWIVETLEDYAVPFLHKWGIPAAAVLFVTFALLALNGAIVAAIVSAGLAIVIGLASISNKVLEYPMTA